MLLIEAVIWLGLARAASLALPFRWTVRLFALRPDPDSTARRAGMPSAVAAVTPLLGWALRAAATRTPWKSTCLAQALAGARMLRRRDLPGRVALGVARSAEPPRPLEAHAWLSSGEEILTGAAEAERFSVVARFTLRQPV